MNSLPGGPGGPGGTPALGPGLGLGIGRPQTSLGGGALQLGGGLGAAATASLPGPPQFSGVPSGGVPSGGVHSGGIPSGGVPSGGIHSGGLPFGGLPSGGLLGVRAPGLQLGGVGGGGGGGGGVRGLPLRPASGTVPAPTTGLLLSAPTSQPVVGSTAATVAGATPLGGGVGLQLHKPQLTSQPTLTLRPTGQTAATAAAAAKPALAGGLTTAPITAGLQLPKPATTTTLGGLTGVSLPTTTGVKATTTTASSGGGAGTGGTTKQYTYKDLEDLINKWSIELQGQEKLFLQEAQQINTWDRLLAENGDKITELNDEVERAKSEQQRLDSELDLIGSQQGELEEILTGLEQSVTQQQPLATSHHADLERTKIYQLAESVDGQLRRMEQDLKEIIEQMNSSNAAEDEDSPMMKVVKILNAHADSLNWIDRNTALLRQKVDEVSKLTEQRRREQERSFRLAFDQ